MELALMTKAEAIYKFMSSFGIDAFPSSYVPEERTFPWITYDNSIGNSGETVYATADLWMNTESEAVINAKVEQIAEAIGRGGTQISYDGGQIWIRYGSPWCSAISEDDSSIKHRRLNINIEFL